MSNFIPERRGAIISLATELFDDIIDIPSRDDDKTRHGIQILVREVGNEKENSIFESIYEPSEHAKFFAAEKAVRSAIYDDYTSQNSADTDLMQYAGCVMVTMNGSKYQASVSGLKSEEDVFIAVYLLAYVLDLTVHYVLSHIRENRGILPNEFSDGEHYLHKMITQVS